MTNPPARHAAVELRAQPAPTSHAPSLPQRARSHSVGWAHRPPRFSLGLAATALLAPLVLGCDKPSAPSAPASASAVSSARAKPPSPAPPAKLTLSCRDEKRGARFLVGEVGQTRPSSAARLSADEAEAEDGEGDAVELPFAVEAGGAVPTEQGFALAALQ